jgi:hypothetical protein
MSLRTCQSRDLSLAHNYAGNKKKGPVSERIRKISERIKLAGKMPRNPYLSLTNEIMRQREIV